MDYYATVYFQRDAIAREYEFLGAMNDTGIITISKEKLSRWREEQENELPRTADVNEIVLHGESVKARFEHIMKTFFPEVKYMITDEPGSSGFKAWLDKVHSTTASRTSSIVEKGGVNRGTDLS